MNSAGGGSVGSAVGSTGTVTVTGPGSSWNNGPSGGLNIGSFGTGTLTIANGGRVIDHSRLHRQHRQCCRLAGYGDGDRPGLHLEQQFGGEYWQPGTGTLTVANGGIVTGPIVIATNGGSIGTLNIGAGAGNPTVAPGTLNSTSVAFGVGAGTLNFNHTSSDYVFAPAISGPGTVNVFAGTTILTAVNTYSGATNVNGGCVAGGRAQRVQPEFGRDGRRTAMNGSSCCLPLGPPCACQLKRRHCSGSCAPEIESEAVVVGVAGVIDGHRLCLFEGVTDELLARPCMVERQVLPGDDPAELPGDAQQPAR